MDSLQFIETSVLDTRQKQLLIQLWNSEYPKNLSYQNLADFEKYLQNLSDIRHTLLVGRRDNILGWAFSFIRNEERWFAILLSETIQGKGLGRIMLDKLKSRESELNGWVIDHNSYKKANGQNYLSPLGFYKRCDFKILTNERLEHEKISAIKIKWTRK